MRLGLRGNSNTQLINDELDIRCSQSLGITDEELTQSANNVLLKTYGIARRPCTNVRSDAGSRKNDKNAKGTDVNSVAGFKSFRDHQVQKEVDECKMHGKEIKRVLQQKVRDAQWSCASFQTAKFQDKLLNQAAKKNSCLNDMEKNIVGDANVLKFKKDEKTKDVAYWRKKISKLTKTKAKPKDCTKDKLCYLDSKMALLSDEIHGSTWKMKFVGTEISRADVFISPSVTDPGLLIEIKACLTGTVVMDRECFVSGLQNGFLLKYDPVLKMKKTWFVSIVLKTKHTKVFEVVKSCFSHPVCQSKLVVEHPTCPAVTAQIDKLMTNAATRAPGSPHRRTKIARGTSKIARGKATIAQGNVKVVRGNCNSAS